MVWHELLGHFVAVPRCPLPDLRVKAPIHDTSRKARGAALFNGGKWEKPLSLVPCWWGHVLLPPPAGTFPGADGLCHPQQV